MDPETPRRHAGLKGRESTDLGSCLAGLANTLARETAGLVATHGLIPLDFALLRLFLRREQWTATQLAQALPVKPPRISRVVNKLVEMGLLARRFPNEDRRVVFLTLTAKGKALTLGLHRRMQAYDARLSEGVSEDEMTVFVSVTSKVIANYAAMAQPAQS